MVKRSRITKEKRESRNGTESGEHPERFRKGRKACFTCIGFLIMALLFGILQLALKLTAKGDAVSAAQQERNEYELADVKVLEIVPSKAMGEMGYLAGGSEPVSVEAYDELCRKDPAQAEVLKSFLLNDLGTHQKVTCVELDPEEAQAWEERWEKKSALPNGNPTMTQSGYFLKITEENESKYADRRKYVMTDELIPQAGPSEDAESEPVITGFAGGFTEVFVSGELPENAWTERKIEETYGSLQPVKPTEGGEGGTEENTENSSEENSTEVNSTEESSTEGNEDGTDVPENPDLDQTPYFVWVPASKADVEEALKDTEGLPCYRDEKLWIRGYIREEHYFVSKNRIENKELFKTEVLGLSKGELDDTSVKILTVSSADINKTENLSLIDEADLVYVNSTVHDYRYVQYYEQYSGKHQGIYYSGLVRQWPTQMNFYKTFSKGGTGVQDTAYNTTVWNDLSWEAVWKIYRKNADNNTPVILDEQLANFNIAASADPSRFNTGYFSGTGNANNSYKLYLMLTTMPVKAMDEIYLSQEKGYLSTAKSAANNKTVTGKFTKASMLSNAANGLIYWSKDIFLPKYQGVSKNYTIQRKSLMPGNEEYWLNMGIIGARETVSGPYLNGNVFVIESRIAPDRDHADSYSGQMPTNALPVKRLTEDNSFLKQMSESLNDSLLEEKTGIADAGNFDVMRHMMSAGEREENSDLPEKLSILEIEPCNDFYPAEYMEGYIRKILGDYQGKIEIEQQTTAEFISKIDSLVSTYDVIYMGDKIGLFNMNGSKAVLEEGLSQFYTEKNVFLYDNSATTKYNMDALNKKIYLHVGDIDNVTISLTDIKMTGYQHNDTNVRYSGNDITLKKKTELEQYVNSGYLLLVEDKLFDGEYMDQTSYLYKFLNDVEGSGKNIIAVDKEQAAAVVEYQRQKPELLFLEKPKDYRPDPDIQGKTKESCVNDGGKLFFRFAVVDETGMKAGDTYEAKLYIDINGDGTYASDELIQSKAGIEPFREKRDSETEEEYRTESFDLTETFERIIKQYTGAISWKIVLENERNRNIMIEQKGYAIYRSADKEKNKIKVLHIYKEETINGSKSFNMKTQLKNTDTFFGEYAANLSEFEFEADAVKFMDFNTANYYFDNENKAEGGLAGMTDAQKKNLAVYDMVVIGFSDVVPDISNKNNLTALYQFKEAGKSIFFSHDTTSFRTTWGQTITKYFRNLFGLDRFGISLGPLKSDQTAQKMGYNKDTIGNILERKDKAWKLNNESGTYWEEHGYTDQLIFQNTRNQYSNHLFNADKGDFITHTVRKVNDGQITSYPFMLPETITVANTHLQYYQLDFDAAGDAGGAEAEENPDLVVWYCLAGGGSQRYDISTNDGRNNYYIYNMGNITYTGSGHRTGSNSDNFASYAGEVQLFVNTLIAAYRPPVIAPEIEITNGYKDNSSTSDYYLYANTDVDNKESLDGMIAVEFTPTDYNIISEYLQLQFLVHDTPARYDLYDVKTGAKIEPDEDGNYEVRSGYQYQVYIPLSLMSGKENEKVIFSVTNISKKTGTATCGVLRRTLFNLD